MTVKTVSVDSLRWDGDEPEIEHLDVWLDSVNSGLKRPIQVFPQDDGYLVRDVEGEIDYGMFLALQESDTEEVHCHVIEDFKPH